MRPHQVWRHRVGTGADADTLVYEEADHRFYVGVGRTRDDRYVLIGLDSKVTSEYRAMPADEPEGRFAVIEPRRQGIEYTVDHDRGDPSTGRGGRFLIVTNDGADDFRLMEAPDDSPGRDSWYELIPARPGVRLDAVDPFADHLVVYEREGGETRARVIDAALGELDGHRAARVPRHGVGRGQPRVRVEDPPLRVHLAGDPPIRLRPRPRDRHLDAPEAPAGAGRLRPGPVPHRTALGHGRRRDAGPPVARLPPRQGREKRTGPTRTVPALRIRLLRGLHRPDLLVAAPQPARPGLRLRHRPRPWWWRDGPVLVRAGQVRGQAQLRSPTSWPVPTP